MRRGLLTGITVFLFCAAPIACGGDASGDDDEGGGDGSGSTSGTCDFRNVDGYVPSCTEYDLDLDEVPGFRESCVTEGGSWSNAPCPSENQFGCCSYVEGDWGLRECRYAENPDLITQEELCAEEATCTGAYEGVWTRGPAFDCTPPPPTIECQQFCAWLAMTCPADSSDTAICQRSCITYYFEDECPQAFATMARCIQQTPPGNIICNSINPYLGDPDPCQQQKDALILCHNQQ